MAPLLPDHRALRLGDLPARAATRWGDRVALYWGDSVETHAEFAANVDRVAKALVALGVESGDHVAVWMTNRPEWLHLLYAVPRIGGCLVPLNTRYRSDDMAYTVVNAETRLLISLERSGPIDYAALLAAARPEIEAAGHLRDIVMLGGPLQGEGSARVTDWADFLAAADAVTDDEFAARVDAVSPQQLMMLAYTSGTTGNPKGVMHDHGPVANMRERAMLLGHHMGDVHLNYLPLFHIYAVSEVAVMAALTGAAQVLFDVFDPDTALDEIERHGATVLHGFDSHWGDLLAAQERQPRDTATLRIGSLPAGMESTTPIARRVQDVFCPTISGFGMSECWAFICCSHPTHTVEQRTEASGYPMDGVEIEVRHPETGARLEPDAAGKLFIRYHTVTAGYWANPDATAATIDADGWLDTGDLARIRPDGHVVFLGRFKDMLKVGGENMAPAEVEGYLLEQDGVAEVAVVGYPDERLSEVPVAYVVRSKDAGEDLVTEEGADRVAPRPDRQLQDPSGRGLRRRDADDALGQDPQGGATRPGAGRPPERLISIARSGRQRPNRRLQPAPPATEPVSSNRRGPEDGDFHHRERAGPFTRRGAANASRPLSQRHRGAHGHQRGLRHVLVRCLHGARERSVGEVVHHAGRSGQRPGDHDHRGSCRSGSGRRQCHRRPELASDAGGVSAVPRSSVRVLHTGHGDGRHQSAQGEPQPDEHRDPGGA